MSRAFASTFERSREVERVAAAYVERRYSGPGNPIGVEFLRIGDLLATKVPRVPGNPLMNAVHRLENLADLPTVLGFYATTQQACWIEIVPYAPIELTDALLHAGFRPVRYSSALYASPVPEPAPIETEITLIDASERDVFLDTMNVGFDTPPAALEVLRRNQSFWTDVAEWKLLLARVDGEPAAAAVLSLHGNHGYFAAASTLPRFRNRGLQSALIARRLELARALGCDAVSGHAEAGSVSQCNQQRAGLAIVHTRCIWSNAT
jgi:GNAT superfamily N-acetyltransferase